MKIVMLCDFYSENQQYQENLLAKYYVRLGHSVTILTSTIDDVFDYVADKYDNLKKEKTYNADEVKIIRQPYKYNIANKLRKFPNVESILIEENPDLIFMHECFWNLKEAAIFKRNNRKCKVIMDYHADYSNSGKNWVSINILHKIFRKSILYRDIKSIDQIFSIVPAGFTFLHEIYGIPYEKIELLPLGVDTEMVKLTLSNKSRDKIRKKLDIPSDSIVIFTGGKLTPLKQTHLVVEAVRAINNPTVHLVIVGSGADVKYIEYLKEISRNDSRIHFTGWLSYVDIYDYMAASDIAIFPSSQSVLWQQAIGMGLVLVVGRYIVLENDKVVHQDVDYLNLNHNVIPLDDISQQNIQDIIVEFCRNRSLLKVMQQGAKKTAREFLCYSLIAERTLQ